VKRRLFNLLAAVSLALCLATVVLWIRGYRIWDDWDWVASDGHLNIQFASSRGKIAWCVSRDSPNFALAGLGHIGLQPVDLHDLGTRASFDLATFGFFIKITHYRSLRWWRVAVPDWFPAALFLLPPIVWTKRRYRRERHFGHCRQCGYDLRATPERCPECGTAASPTA